MNFQPVKSIYIISTFSLLLGLTSCSRGENPSQSHRATDSPSKQIPTSVMDKISSSLKMNPEVLNDAFKKRTFPEWTYEARWYYVNIENFHQGNLHRLTKRLLYLKSLGVNTLFVGSVFYRIVEMNSKLSYLKYHHINDSLGVKDSYHQVKDESADPKTWKFSASDQMFIDFLDVAHKNGFRVIVEGPFNSIYNNIPHELSGEHILAVTRRWMDPNADGDTSDGVDGWVTGRLTMSLDDFQWNWYSKIVELNPECLLVEKGQHAQEPPPSNHRIVSFLTPEFHRPSIIHHQSQKIPARRSKAQIVDSIFRSIQTEKYVMDFTLVFDLQYQCLLTNLDQPQILSTRNGKPTAGAYKRWKLATIMQHFLPGVPITYCGDEIGMYGGPTQKNARRPMWWNDLPHPKTKSPDYRGDFFALIKWLHEMREKYAPLRRGDFRTVMTDDDKKIFAFSRSYKGEEVILVMNVGSKKQMVMLPAGKPGQIVATLSPQLTPRPPRGSKTVDYTKIKTMHVGGVRQFVNKEGKIRIWINPMSVRVVIVNEN